MKPEDLADLLAAIDDCIERRDSATEYYDLGTPYDDDQD